MATAGPIPLDLAKTGYSYVERPNLAILRLLERHVLSKRRARILDVGCGCGANARAVHERRPDAFVLGIEPNQRAVELARSACSEVFHGTVEAWQGAAAAAGPFDAVVLADVLEHIADPIAFLRGLVSVPALRAAVWIVSVPNYAVWYNRVATLFGAQRYRWSGLWDRTHLRFFTKRSAGDLLEYCGLSVVEAASTPSLVQSAAPVLRAARRVRARRRAWGAPGHGGLTRVSS